MKTFLVTSIDTQKVMKLGNNNDAMYGVILSCK